MKTKLIALTLTLLLTGTGYAQPPVLWQYLYGGTSQDYCNDAIEVEDGLLFAGSTISYGAGNDDFFLVKTDFDGTVIWQQTYGTAEEEECFSIAPTNDGGFILGGSVCISGPKDMLLVKVDCDGNELWSQTFDYGQFDVITCVRQTQDGGFILGGYSYIFDNEDMVLVKTDAAGNEVWMHTYATIDYERGEACLEAIDGGYIIAGTRSWFGPVGAVGRVVKTDDLGNEMWTEEYYGNGVTRLNDIKLSGDTQYVLTGSTSPSSTAYSDAYLMVINVDGRIAWDATYGTDFEEYGNSVACTIDGGYILTGLAYFNLMTENQVYVVKTDGLGNTQWYNYYGGMAWDEGMAVVPSVNGGYVIGGYSNSPPASAFDMLLMRLDSDQTIPEILVELTYQSGSPIPAGGGDIYFDVYVENYGTSAVSFDAWLDISYEGYEPATVVQRSFEEYQPGWSINRPNMFYPIPGLYAPGNYTMYGRVGFHPATIWDESSFPFVKEGVSDGLEFVPYAVDGAPNPFEQIDKGETVVLETHQLLSSFPNPFNPETTLHYVVPQAGQVKLAIYNTLGQEVASLVNRMEEAGRHRVTWSGEAYPAGVYIARLTVDGQAAQTQKLVLVK